MFASATAPLVDSHVHLDRYTDEEVRRFVARAEAAGVRRLLTVGTDPASSQGALALAARYPTILAAVGIHPTRLTVDGPTPETWDALTPGPSAARREHPSTRKLPRSAKIVLRNDIAQGLRRRPLRGRGEHADILPLPIAMGRGLGGGASPLEQIRSLLEAGPAAIGEVGLDEHAPDMEGQAQFLDACLALAEAHQLPVVLHVVGAPAIHERALALVARRPSVRTVAHYFVGGPDLARRYLEHGCWISVGRPVTRPSETAVRQAVPLIPLDRLLLETDTYPLPGRTTEPRDVTSVCAAVAELAGRSYEAIAEATTTSFAAFIGR